jgi:O-antigen ligase
MSTRLVRLTFYLFVFSIPFELPMFDLPLDVPRATGAVFIAATLLDPGVYRRMPWVLPLFLVYLGIFIASFLINGAQYAGEATRLLVQLAQMMLLFWAAAQLLRTPRTAHAAMIAFASACALRAAVQVLRVPVLASVAESHRATAFGQNANQSAMVLAAGMLVLISLQYGRDTAWLRPRLLAWPLLAVMAVALFETGSRGGIAAFTLGLVVFTTAVPGWRHKLQALALLIVAAGTFYLGASHSELMQKRLRLAEQGNLAGREQIYPALLTMWTDRPIIGWGPIVNKYELGDRLAEPVRRRRGAHNLVLEVLTSTGLMGALFYLTAVSLCVVAAWRGRYGAYGALPLALLVTLLITNLSGDWPVAPLWWFALAFGVASSAAAGAPPLQRLKERVPCAV